VYIIAKVKYIEKLKQLTICKGGSIAEAKCRVPKSGPDPHYIDGSECCSFAVGSGPS
jgi:hypothetical protein